MNEIPITGFRRGVQELRELNLDEASRGFYDGISILHAVRKLDGDELDVVGLIVERLSLGRGIYGQWVASADLRDHEREALDEELDDVVYRAMRTLINRRHRIGFVLPELSAADRAVIKERLRATYRGPASTQEVINKILEDAGCDNRPIEPVKKVHRLLRWFR